jgi:hypothetical protein
MKIGLAIIPKLCFLGIIIYAYASLKAASWATRRHEGKLLFLEWQPSRARGTQELKRLARLRLLRLVAFLSAGVVGAVKVINVFQ